MSSIRYPTPLNANSRIAITAPSSGLSSPAQVKRLELINSQWRARGYQIVEGQSVRKQFKDASAPAELRAE